MYPLQFYLMLPGMFHITFPNSTFFVSCNGGLTPHFPFPINTAKVYSWFAADALDFKAFMTDPYIITVSLVGTILDLCPLLSPDSNIFFLLCSRSLILLNPSGSILLVETRICTWGLFFSGRIHFYPHELPLWHIDRSLQSCG